MLPSVATFDAVPDAVLTALRDAFARGGFARETIDRMDAVAPGAPGPVRLPLVCAELERRTEPDLRLALLFTFGGVLPRGEVDERLGAATAAALVEAGFLIEEGGRVRCPFRVVPMEKLWVVSDGIMDEPESVMPPGPTTALLADLLPGRIEGSIVDVGCGPGSLALAGAARGATRVVGTDINERAIVMARLNARLNGVAAEFRTGNALEPVRGERFDRIVSQPPYIVKPADVGGIQFLHGGPRGDAVTLDILRHAAEALTPGGELLLLCDLALRRDESIGQYLSTALGACGLDLLVLHCSGLTPHQHAIAYAKHGSFEMGAAYILEVRRYMAHLERENIEAFRQTLIVEGRTAPDARSLWLTPFPVRHTSHAGFEVRERMWHSATAPRLSDQDLLRRRVRVAPGAEWMSLRRAPEGDQHEHRVRFGAGWPALEQIVTDEGLMLCSLLERSGNVEEAVAGYAELCESTPAEVRAPLLGYIRDSLMNGMLVFEESTDGR